MAAILKGKENGGSCLWEELVDSPQVEVGYASGHLDPCLIVAEGVGGVSCSDSKVIEARDGAVHLEGEGVSECILNVADMDNGALEGYSHQTKVGAGKPGSAVVEAAPCAWVQEV